jgi:hypothetical protein
MYAMIINRAAELYSNVSIHCVKRESWKYVHAKHNSALLLSVINILAYHTEYILLLVFRRQKRLACTEYVMMIVHESYVQHNCCYMHSICSTKCHFTFLTCQQIVHNLLGRLRMKICWKFRTNSVSRALYVPC